MDTVAQLSKALAGRYSVDREIGRGGMATVYLARDLKHDRHVALKLLNPELGAVLGVERFLSEIRVTANLQHPNLLPLFDSGEVDGQLFYVMPYVEGESLRHRLEREKQLPIDEAVRIALGIAGALDYAHAHDVIHRDLKPENILLQHGEPVIADFGIALAVSRAGGSRVTQTGLSLGTPQYMSPEQATGDRAIDGRSDIYSLGAMLYEMIGGEAPHSGSTGQAIIAKLMTEEPRRLELLRRAVPENVAEAVHRALEKLPADRWRSAKEFAGALRDPRAVTGTRSTGTRMRTHRALAVAAAIFATIAIGEGVALLARPASEELPTLRFRFVTPDSARFISTTPAIPFSISPDDRRVVYVGSGPTDRRLYVRGMDDLDTRALPGTDGLPLQPTFSPDGESVAFIIGGRLVRTPVTAGQTTTIMSLDGRSNAGMSWVDPDTIVAAIGYVLTAIPVNGGKPVVLSRPDTTRGEMRQVGPRVVNKRFIAYVSTGAGGYLMNRLAILDRKTGVSNILDISCTTVLGMVDDHLLWITPRGAAMAARIDGSGTLGPTRMLLEDVLVRPGGAAKATLSAKGSLLYHQGNSLSRLVHVDERGTVTPLEAEARGYSHPRWSPDGSRIAVAISRSGGSDIWVLDARGRGERRISPTAGSAEQPEWTPDGKSVIFRYLKTDGLEIWRASADGSGDAERLVADARDPYGATVSHDGKRVLYAAVGTVPSRGGDLIIASISGERGDFIAATPGHEYTPSFSPDDSWIVYVGLPDGQPHVLARPATGGPAVRISTGAFAHEPLWSRDGRTIFYRRAREVFAARLAPGPSPTVQSTTLLFTADLLADQGYGAWDASADGKRFLMLQNVDRQEETVMIYNWAAELRRTWK